MTQPLVSVIVPAHNASQFITATLQSALDQTYSCLEVVVVDDGSSDGTAEIVEGIAATDSRVRLVRQRNQGVAAARNRAIAASHGEYLAPLDADDIWLPTKLEAQVARMEAGGPRMGLVYTWWFGIDEDGRTMGMSTCRTDEGWLHRALIYMNFVGNASVPLLRRSAVDHVGAYDPSLRARDAEGCEDWDLSLRVAARYRVGVAPGFLTGYRRVDHTMSTDTETMRRSFELVLERTWREHPGLPPALLRWSRGNFNLYLARLGVRSRSGSIVARSLLEAFRADPVTMTSSLVPRTAVRTGLWLARSAARRGGTLIGVDVPPGRSRRRHRGIGAARSPWYGWDPHEVVRRRRWAALTADALGPSGDATPTENLPAPGAVQG